LITSLSDDILSLGFVNSFPQFIDIVVTHLNERDDTIFWQTLMTFKVLLQKIGFKVWVRGQFTPENVVNELFKKFSSTSDQKAHQAIMVVFTTLLASLERSTGIFKKKMRITYF
jgi:hypothetical protein